MKIASKRHTARDLLECEELLIQSDIIIGSTIPPRRILGEFRVPSGHCSDSLLLLTAALTERDLRVARAIFLFFFFRYPRQRYDPFAFFKLD